VTKGEVAVKETENQIKKVLTDDEFKSVDSENDDTNIVFKSKILEYVKSMMASR